MDGHVSTWQWSGARGVVAGSLVKAVAAVRIVAEINPRFLI